jgi:uncharacterized protein YecE (DUF72 family)
MTSNKVQFLIGTSGWSYDHWKGVFYPQNLPKSKWFEYYAEKFPAVEVNATFYRTFKDQTYQKWYDKAPENFKYVFKAPRLITHRKYLKDVDGIIKSFWKSASIVKEKFGLILLQLAPKTSYDPKLLKNALLAFDDPRKVAVEFRHNQWLTEEIKNVLKEVGAIFCSVDSPKIHLIDWVTSDTAYLRFHGRKKWYSYDYSQEELKEVADLINKMATEGAKQIYIFFNNDFEGFAPKNAFELLGILDK